jgi:hypothetical protein
MWNMFHGKMINDCRSSTRDGFILDFHSTIADSDSISLSTLCSTKLIEENTKKYNEGEEKKKKSIVSENDADTAAAK